MRALPYFVVYVLPVCFGLGVAWGGAWVWLTPAVVFGLIPLADLVLGHDRKEPTGQEGSNLVYLTWIDGYDNPTTNGSTIGYVTGSSMETSIVHNGRQSVPVMYDNSVASLSEVTVNTNDLAVGRDWTVGSPEMLMLWVYGDPNNAAEPMYIAVNNVVVPNEDANAALVTEWIQWDIPLQSLADQGVNLNNIGSMTIGFGNPANPIAGGSGVVFFDAIRLYRSEE